MKIWILRAGMDFSTIFRDFLIALVIFFIIGMVKEPEPTVLETDEPETVTGTEDNQAVL